jgi:type III secretion protein Q
MSASATEAPAPIQPTAQGGGGPPLPSAVTPAHVSVLNAFYRRRQALAATIGGEPATIMSTWPPTSPAASDGYAPVGSRVTLSIDGEEGELSLPRKLVEVLIAGVDPALSLDRMRPDRAAIVVEFALAAPLDALEATLGWRLALTSIGAPHKGPSRPDLVALSFALTFARFGTFICELRLAPGRALNVIRNLDQSTAFAGADVDLPVPVSLRFAAATLTVGDVRDLSPGDVVIVDEHGGTDGTAVVVIAEHLVAPIQLNAAGGVLTAHPTRGCGSQWEWSMDNKSEPSRRPVTEALELDELPLRIVFEVGRLELSLGDVRQMAPGTVLPLSRPFDEALDIMASGRRIGRGEIVRIGDSLGVRIIRLFDNV